MITPAHEAWRKRLVEKNYVDYRTKPNCVPAEQTAFLAGMAAEYQVARLVGLIEALDTIGNGTWTMEYAMLARHRDACTKKLNALLAGGEKE